jgi:hypothetical protein
MELEIVLTEISQANFTFFSFGYRLKTKKDINIKMELFGKFSRMRDKNCC